MNFLTKIEDFINNLLIRFSERILGLLKRATPHKLIQWLMALKAHIVFGVKNFKAMPGLIKKYLLELVARTKTKFAAIDFKAKVAVTLKTVESHYKAQSSRGASKFKAVFVAPFILLSHWLQGLSAVQSVLLLTFTFSSIIAGINMVSSGRRMMANQHGGRTPASAQEDVSYDRPNYYKKDSRHVLVTSVRLPVYFAGVNELRSVDIDFNLTLSNRLSKKFLEKYEFQLRDYLILNVEPIIASFPLEEEGRDILKDKIWRETDNFLKERNIEGQVEECKITYALAN